MEYEYLYFEEPVDTVTELARQIRLHFADAPTLYLSWTFDRQHGEGDQPYSITFGEASYFSDQPSNIVDASGSALWRRHIGRRTEVAYRRANSPNLDWQVIEVRSGPDCTFVYSLGVDKVRLSGESPI